MIPKFPNFKSIELSDRTDVEAYTTKFEPYSDFDFTCLWIWDTNKKRMISDLNGNLVVMFTDYTTQEPFISFLGENDREETLQTLMEYCKTKGLTTTLKLIPEISVQSVNSSVFAIQEDRDAFDYVYSIQALIELRGVTYDSKRGRLHKFWHEYPRAAIEPIDLTSTDVQFNVLTMFSRWEKNKLAAKNGKYAGSHEREATERLLKETVVKNTCAVGLFLETNMIGYFLGEVIQDSYTIGRFAKYDVTYKGVYEALLHGYAKHLASIGVSYLNVESDLGVEGMRRSKMSWRPVKFLKRYHVQYAQI